MKTVQLQDLTFQSFISEEELKEIVSTLAYQVSHDLDENEIPIFIGILNGSFLFVSDFVRQFPRACEVSFVKLHSYAGTQSTEVVNELIGINEDLTNRTVIILEDIIDFAWQG